MRHIHFKDMGCIGCKIRSETPSQKTVKKTSDYGINYREPKSSGYGSRTFSVSSATKQGSSDNTTLALWTAGIICLAFLFLMSSSGSDKSGSSSSAVPLSSSSSGSPSVVTGDGYIANKSRLEYLVGATGSKEVTLDTVMRGNLRSGYDRIAAKDNYIALAQDIHREVDRVRSNIRIEDGLVVFPQVNLLYLPSSAEFS